MEIIRLGHTHSRRCETVQGFNFGALPGIFLRFAAVAAAFFHGASAPTVFDFAAFGVIRALAKTALIGFFVNFGTTHVIAAAHHEYHGFFAAHQLANDFIHQSVFDQRLNSLWGFHYSVLSGYCFNCA